MAGVFAGGGEVGCWKFGNNSAESNSASGRGNVLKHVGRTSDSSTRFNGFCVAGDEFLFIAASWLRGSLWYITIPGTKFGSTPRDCLVATSSILYPWSFSKAANVSGFFCV